MISPLGAFARLGRFSFIRNGVATLAVLSLFITVAPTTVFADMVGPRYPANAVTGGGSGTAWSSPGSNLSTAVNADSGSVAQVTLCGNGGSCSNSSENLNVTNFGFNIDDNAVIVGIKVEANRYRNSSGGSSGDIQDVEVRLLGGTGVDNKATSSPWSSDTNAVVTYGGVSDDWGTDWTPAQINSSNFGVTFDIQRQNINGSRTANYDYVRVTVYYTIPDTSVPTVTLTSTSSATVTGAFLVTATTSEPVSGLTLGEIAVTGGTASGLTPSTGTSTVYTFTVTPSAEAVSVSIPADAVTDGTNGNTASNVLERVYAAPGEACSIDNADNLIENPCFETGLSWGTVPDDTATSSWFTGKCELNDDCTGSNDAVFSIVSGAHSGNNAAQVTISNFTANSDAKWINTEVPVLAGEFYTFSFWYKVSGAADAFLVYNLGDYDWKATLPNTNTWTKYENYFFVPEDVSNVQITAALASVGTLTTDDYSLVEDETPPVFDEGGRVSFTFDDGWVSQLEAVDALNLAGLKGTFYIVSQQLADVGEGYDSALSTQNVKDIYADGHEIGAHTRTHADLTTLSTSSLADELSSKSDLETLLDAANSVKTFAYPYGAYNAQVQQAVYEAGFIGARSVDQNFNLSTALTQFDEKFALKIQHVTNETTVDDIEEWINEAEAHKTWLVLMFHDLSTTTPSADTCSTDDGTGDLTECASVAILQSAIDHIVEGNICVQTVADVLEGISCNKAPNINSISNVSTPVHTEFTVTPIASDADGDTLTFSMAGPSGSTIDSATGKFVWTPSLAGTTSVTIFVNDNKGGTASTTFEIEVTPDNTNPTVVLNTTAGGATNANVIPVMVTFSEVVTGFLLEDVTVTNGTKVNFAEIGDGKTFTFDIVDMTEGAIEVNISSAVAEDLSGNDNEAAVALVVVYDITAPVIELIDSNPLATTTQEAAYIDPGATTTDGTPVVITGEAEVNLEQPGTYTVYFSATDLAGNTASTTRDVNVSDNDAPVFSGFSDIVEEATGPEGAEIDITELPTATDAVDGEVTVECGITLGTQLFPVGTTTVSCAAEDSEHNEAGFSFNVVVQDTVAPEVTAPADQTFEAEGEYTAPEGLELASAADAVSSTTVTYSPSAFPVGTTTVTWTAIDAAGNSAATTSLVIITDTTKPIIALNGDAIVFVTQGGEYDEQGATAVDLVDGSFDAAADGSVDTETEGEYTITYSATDAAGNAADEVTRTVVVTSLEFSEEGAVVASHESVTITWTTSHPASSRVLFDTVSHSPLTSADAPNYGYASSTDETDTAENATTTHSVTITGLTPSTAYYFRPVSIGSPETLGEEVSAQTSQAPEPAPVQQPRRRSGGGGGSSGGGIVGGEVLGASTGSLTEAQIQAILNVLKSFNAPQDVLDKVEKALRGQTFGGSQGGAVLGASTSFTFTQTLQLGSTGSEVTELQKVLIAKGFLAIAVPTGYFGSMTEAAVKAYQTANGIEAVGIVGPQTRAALNAGK